MFTRIIIAAGLALASFNVAAKVKCDPPGMDGSVQCESEPRAFKRAAATYSLFVHDGRASLIIIGLGATPPRQDETFMSVDGQVQAYRSTGSGTPSCSAIPPYSCNWRNGWTVRLPPGELRRLVTAKEILWARFASDPGVKMDPARLAGWLAELEAQGIHVD